MMTFEGTLFARRDSRVGPPTINPTILITAPIIGIITGTLRRPHPRPQSSSHPPRRHTPELIRFKVPSKSSPDEPFAAVSSPPSADLEAPPHPLEAER